MASNQPQDAQVRKTLQNDQGVAVHSFDPDASPEEKAAVAGKARDQLKDIRPKDTDPAKGSSLKISEPDRASPSTPIARARCRYRKLRCHPHDNRPRCRRPSRRCCHDRTTCSNTWINRRRSLCYSRLVQSRLARSWWHRFLRTARGSQRCCDSFSLP